MESVSLIAAGASSASSAYSSMMMTSAGISGDISQVRLPTDASNAARASSTATASRSRARACPGVVAILSMHDAQGPSSMPFFRSIAQRTTSRQAARLPISTLSPPLLPDPVVPPKMPCTRAKSTRHGDASSNGPRSIDWVIEVTDGPGHGIAPACGSTSRTRISHLLARSSGVGYTRTAPRNVPRPDSSAGIFPVTSVMVWPRARRSRARHPHTSTVADMISDPARPIALAISGQACSLRSMRTFARRRRCAHHGTDKTSAATIPDWNSGGQNGPSAMAADSHTPAT